MGIMGLMVPYFPSLTYFPAAAALFAGPGIRDTPKQPRLVLPLLGLEGLELNEMHLAAETGDDRAFFVATPDPFLVVGILAGVKAGIGPPGPSKVLNLRFPESISRRVELSQLVRLAA